MTKSPKETCDFITCGTDSCLVKPSNAYDQSFPKGAGGEGEKLFKGAAGCSSTQQVKTQITIKSIGHLDDYGCYSTQQVKGFSINMN